ncbi:cytochrome c oxidase assembly protein [Paenibacillus chondroitinus]|uniref:Cytochrome c oxidase assembly protein n=1 Tax=Paenibacillus chondroitinus TaxID=59842 RepID=A0ABU6DIJ9_9BACL|nr:cytochrome c oxidase assembly protein [Paenibacillus chondroitinus]MCY9659423.1 cytochrome c oxidase assembly protein [Paenibacillus anseongense]MEB4796818.1 cytochrome c oxidase assembly protein [Paenibacillus chondroitinus]
MNTNIFHDYSFFELWSPVLFFILLVSAIGYLNLLAFFKKRLTNIEPVKLRHKIYFIIGLFLFYIANGGPLGVLAHHYLFSAHMVQQSLLLFIVPPLILLGIPKWLVRAVFPWKLNKKIAGIASNPILAILTFNGLLTLYHFPVIFDSLMSTQYYWLGTLYELILFVTALQIWWFIICPIPELDELSDLKKIAFLIINGLLIYPVCTFIMFADGAIYNTYSTFPQIIGFLDPHTDQQSGGVIMKAIQEIVFVIALSMVFKRWYRKENSGESIIQ